IPEWHLNRSRFGVFFNGVVIRAGHGLVFISDRRFASSPCNSQHSSFCLPDAGNRDCRHDQISIEYIAPE
ncbi:TPA: hypothetical protein ACIVON_005417, partial [Salmonella enterica subsp. enterica serovar Poona]